MTFCGSSEVPCGLTICALLTLLGSPTPMSQQLRVTSCKLLTSCKSDLRESRARYVECVFQMASLALPASLYHTYGVSWDVTPCSLVVRFHCFGGTSCLLDGVIEGAGRSETYECQQRGVVHKIK